MSRPFSRMKLGYYPLPVEETHNIRTLLIPSGAYSAIDPCAGDGSAVIEITRGTGAHLRAIELDADRAAACAQKGIETVHGSAFECRVLAESCSLLYLNPPYDTELGPHNNKRMELVFLDHCYRWVIAEGVLVFVIPVTALSACARLLASQSERIGIFRLTHPECVRFKQIVLFGKRKKSHARGDPASAEALVRASYHQELIPPLGEQVVERYAVPPSPPATINYTGLPIDVLEDALQRSTAMQNARGVLVRKQQKLTGRPVLPLHKGGVGLLACSGMLNGVFGEGEQRHIAHWRSVKHVDEFTEEGEEEGETIIHKRERFSHELTLAYADGTIVELKTTEEVGQDD
jgi:Uncharacterised methyltransferase family (DUF6094)